MLIHLSIISLLFCGALSQEGDNHFLNRRGNQLLMNEKPFRSVGVNKHELLDFYMADLMGGDLGSSLSEARNSLDMLQDLGVDTIRVRASQFWPAQIEKTYLAKENQGIFWQRFDMMMEDCSKRSIRIIPTIAWHIGAWVDLAHESLQDFVRNPYSISRQMFNDWVRDLVSRYKDSSIILFWELTNEANLMADLRPQLEKGVIPPNDLVLPHKHIVQGPVIRDRRNHMSSDELAALTRETTKLIKSIDPNHLVGTGFSRPRKAAWHLWLGSIRRSDKMDWTEDDPQQQADYLRLITPEPVDLISFHYYLSKDSSFQQIKLIKQTADQMNKPVYCGEMGVSASDFPDVVYDNPQAQKGLEIMLELMQSLDIPVTLLWTWDERKKPFHEPVIRPKQHQEILEFIRKYNNQSKIYNLKSQEDELEKVDSRFKNWKMEK